MDSGGVAGKRLESGSIEQMASRRSYRFTDNPPLTQYLSHHRPLAIIEIPVGIN